MTSALPLILLPPSEGKSPGGNGPPWAPGALSLSELDDRRRTTLDALARAMRGTAQARERLLGVKGAALAAATEANRVAATAPTMPAIERYTGVLYGALDHRTLGTAARRRLDACVLILSGLWGAVAPGDPIPEYKVKMGASLPRIGRLSTWWRDDLSAAIARRADARTIWNLLPHEHAAAWRAPIDLPQYSATFLERRPNGSLVAVSHSNKSLKGALVRFLLTHPGARPADLAGWEHPAGYRYDPSRTDVVRGVTVLRLVQGP
jgi:cytoplasmic iron level regulating protein YaaA (DUF328/UPF0246 family)